MAACLQVQGRESHNCMLENKCYKKQTNASCSAHSPCGKLRGGALHEAKAVWSKEADRQPEHLHKQFSGQCITAVGSSLGKQLPSTFGVGTCKLLAYRQEMRGVAAKNGGVSARARQKISHCMLGKQWCKQQINMQCNGQACLGHRVKTVAHLFMRQGLGGVFTVSLRQLCSCTCADKHGQSRCRA